MPEIHVPKNRKECNKLLNEIEAGLVRAFPEAINSMGITDRAYGMLICYIDLTTNSYAPFAAILPESHRARCVANRDVETIWMIAEIPSWTQCGLPEGGELERQCNAVYAYLSSGWDNQDEYKVILPFRRMIYRVCLALNEIDWSKNLPVTDDFTVMASDWSTGLHIGKDAKASVPRGKRQLLSKKGMFFNPSKLPHRMAASVSLVERIANQPPEEQARFWIRQLDSLYRDQECEARAAGVGEKMVVEELGKLQPLGGEALLGFIEAVAGEPEWTLQEHYFGPTASSMVLGAAVEGIKQLCSPTVENEKRLWEAFDVAVEVNEPGKYWGVLPSKLAFCIKDMFQDKRRYRYWVVSDHTSRIKSLKEIREERREKGPG